MSKKGVYGVLAEFTASSELIAAVRAVCTAGYRKLDAYSPFPIRELETALEVRKTRIPLYMFIGGALSGALGYFMQWWASVISYPLNIGGRPLHSWPSFIPPTFELTILGAAITGFIAVLVRNKLPQPYHPLFGVPGFERATQDRFFLCIQSDDENFDETATPRLLSDQGPWAVTLVRTDHESEGTE